MERPRHVLICFKPLILAWFLKGYGLFKWLQFWSLAWNLKMDTWKPRDSSWTPSVSFQGCILEFWKVQNPHVRMRAVIQLAIQKCDAIFTYMDGWFLWHPETNSSWKLIVGRQVSFPLECHLFQEKSIPSHGSYIGLSIQVSTTWVNPHSGSHVMSSFFALWHQRLDQCQPLFK